jgi:hypothetical protein
MEMRQRGSKYYNNFKGLKGLRDGYVLSGNTPMLCSSTVLVLTSGCVDPSRSPQCQNARLTLLSAW